VIVTDTVFDPEVAITPETCVVLDDEVVTVLENAPEMV
jgi:hypothetical protein